MVLVLVTLISRDWIERLTGFDPDRGSGTVEWLAVVVLAVSAAALGLGARLEWRRHLAAVDSSAGDTW